MVMIKIIIASTYWALSMSQHFAKHLTYIIPFNSQTTLAGRF